MHQRTIVFAVAIAVLLTHGCKDDSNPVDPGQSPGAPTTITGADGAKVTIPEGALQSSEKITIDPVNTAADLPVAGPFFLEYGGGVNVQPHGLEFLKPVALTIPLARTVPPGDTVPLFYFNDSLSAWQLIEPGAVVDAGGATATASVTHFSLYTIQMGGNVFDSYTENYGSPGHTLVEQFNAYQTWFQQNIVAVGDKRTYEFALVPYSCYKVVGIDFHLIHDLGLVFTNPLHNLIGTTGDVELFYYLEGSKNSTSGGERAFQLWVKVYLDCCAPELKAAASPTSVKRDEKSTISATLTCGDSLMREQDIVFSLDGPGEIDKAYAPTGNSGAASVTFTAKNNGTPSVAARYTACGINIGSAVEVADTVDLRVATPAQLSYSGTVTGRVVTMAWADIDLVVRTHADFTFSLSPKPGSDTIDMAWPYDVTGSGMAQPTADLRDYNADFRFVGVKSPLPFPIVVSGRATLDTVEISIDPDEDKITKSLMSGTVQGFSAELGWVDGGQYDFSGAIAMSVVGFGKLALQSGSSETWGYSTTAQLQGHPRPIEQTVEVTVTIK
ncbi:MAG: hypothetical protein GF350_01960 [Chitinivibrionales bacterium]|nr:hypothetical protein [Chitinivibrionales bacterium]